MVKVYQDEKGTLVQRTKGLKQAKSAAVREYEEQAKARSKTKTSKRVKSKK